MKIFITIDKDALDFADRERQIDHVLEQAAQQAKFRLRMGEKSASRSHVWDTDGYTCGEVVVKV